MVANDGLQRPVNTGGRKGLLCCHSLLSHCIWQAFRNRVAIPRRYADVQRMALVRGLEAEWAGGMCIFDSVPRCGIPNLHISFNYRLFQLTLLESLASGLLLLPSPLSRSLSRPSGLRLPPPRMPIPIPPRPSSLPPLKPPLPPRNP
jgi:hypothetical protein